MLHWRAGLASLVPVWVSAQPATQPLWVVERVEQARWTYAAEFMPLAMPEQRMVFFIDSVTPAVDHTQLHLRFGPVAQMPHTGVLLLGAQERVIGTTVVPFQPPRMPDIPMDTLSALAWRHLPGRPAPNGGLQLLQAQLRELMQVAGLGGRATGARWTDTVSWSVASDGFRQAMRGTRHRTIVADTVVDGRRYRVVRDSAHLTVDETAWLREFSLDSLTRLTRTATGPLVTEALVEEGSGFIRHRVDHAAMVGTATVRYATGTSYTAPVRLDLAWRWNGMTAEDHNRVMQQGMATFRRSLTAMVTAPTVLDTRVREGDAAARDSLLALVLANPRDSANILRMRHLSFVPDSGERLVERLMRRQVEAGDTTLLVRLLAHPSRPGPRYSREDLQRVVELLDRPDRLLAHGLLADDLLGSITAMIVWNAPILGGATPACEAAACQVLAGARDATHHPRTRDLALVMGALVDPRRYADSVKARARVEAAPFREVLPLIHGIGATWTIAAGAPLPPPDASWRQWIDWAQAPNPAYVSLVPPLRPSPLPSGPRFEDSHRRALQYQQALTGRDFVAEFRRAYTRSSTDSARLTFGTMLLGLGALRRGWDELARELQAGTPAAVSLARAEVTARLQAASTTAERAEASAPEAAELEDALVQMAIGESPPPWPDIAERFVAAPARAQQTVRSTGRTYLFDAERTPPALVARWAGRIDTISTRGWDALPPARATVRLRVTAARRYGPFYSLSMATNGLLPPRGDLPASRYSAATYLIVMRWNDRWWVISTASSVS